MADEINTDVKLAFETIKAKQPPYNLMYAYYIGRHPLKYSASRLKKVFQKLDAFIAENWISVIVDSVLDRLVLKGFDVSEGKQADARLDEIWSEYNLQLIADDVHESAEITGEGYLIALPSERDTDEPPLPTRIVNTIKAIVGISPAEQTAYDIYFNDARMCHVFYDFDRPNLKRFAAKIYTGEDKYARMTLYYPDRFEYYKSNTILKKDQWLTTAAVFIPDDELPAETNEYGVIPVFHFPLSRASGRKPLGPSELSLQDAINKLLADMLASAEFSTWVQRVIIAQADPGELQNIPGANWFVPAGDGKGQASAVVELGGRPLTPFLDAIDKLAMALAVISRTPKHYFFDQSGDPSGEALVTMESPLVKKCKKRIEVHSVEWQNFAKYLLLLEGMRDIKRSQIVTTWEKPEQVSPKIQAETIKIEGEAGIPLVTSVTRQGWAKDEIEQMQKDRAAEKKAMSGLAQDALDKLRAQNAQDNTQNDMPMAMRGDNQKQ